MCSCSAGILCNVAAASATVEWWEENVLGVNSHVVRNYACKFKGCRTRPYSSNVATPSVMLLADGSNNANSQATALHLTSTRLQHCHSSVKFTEEWQRCTACCLVLASCVAQLFE
jgi:hypothetical protein